MDEKEVKKLSLKSEKLKANRASETEKQMKERLRIRVKMIEQEGEPKSTTGKEKGRQKQKTTRNSAWPLFKDFSELMKMSWSEN